MSGRKLEGKPYEATAKVTADKVRIERLKEQYLSTPMTIDNERVRIMAGVYEDTAGYQQIVRRAKFFEQLIEKKKLYIDDNIIVGSMASTINGVYTYPEWNVEWMKEENTVENSTNEEDRKANEWALEYWDKWALRPRADEIFIKKYGYDPDPVYQSGLVAEFMSWPGGGGNLNYPRVYNEGLASMIAEVTTVKELQHYRNEGVLTVEMEASALFTVGAYRNVSVSSVFAISDILSEDGWKQGYHSNEKNDGLRRIFEAALETISNHV